MLRKLVTQKALVCHLISQQFLREAGRLSPGTECDTELHRPSTKSGRGGTRGDHYFRVNNFFFSPSAGPEPCLWELASPTFFGRAALQKRTAHTAWVGRLRELKAVVATSAFHRLLPAEDCSKPAAGDRTFRPWKLRCPRECSLRPLQEDLKPLYFLISHGLLQSLVSFPLLLVSGVALQRRCRYAAFLVPFALLLPPLRATKIRCLLPEA